MNFLICDETDCIEVDEKDFADIDYNMFSIPIDIRLESANQPIQNFFMRRSNNGK